MDHNACATITFVLMSVMFIIFWEYTTRLKLKVSRLRQVSKSLIKAIEESHGPIADDEKEVLLGNLPGVVDMRFDKE